MRSPADLQEYQTGFKNYLLDEDLDNRVFSVEIKMPQKNQNYDSFSYIQKRLNIYKNNMYFSLIEALGSLYPVVKRIVGEEFFKRIARLYIQKNPPLNSVISNYGEFFSIFIENQKNCQGLPYLPHVAKLEWNYQQAFNARDEVVLKSESLAEFTQEELLGLGFKLNASVHFLVSIYPIDDIWHENLKPDVGEINLQCEKINELLIYRKGLQVQVINLKPEVFQLLSLLAEGKTIEQAWTAVKIKALVSDDDLSGIFAYLLSLSVFSKTFFPETTVRR